VNADIDRMAVVGAVLSVIDQQGISLVKINTKAQDVQRSSAFPSRATCFFVAEPAAGCGMRDAEVSVDTRHSTRRRGELVQGGLIFELR
jgi:hypothetical protein